MTGLRTTLPTRPWEWIALGIAAVLIGLAGWAVLTRAAELAGGRDMAAYWEAAERIRAGRPLYESAEAANATELYRYAPWFAYAWVPLTFLPRAVVALGWSALLLAAALATTVPLARRGLPGIAAIGLLLPIQLEGVAYGNVQPLLVAWLVWSISRPSGPIGIALAASLKAVPILLVLVYVGRRQFGRALLALGLTAVLTLPMLLFDLRDYSVAPGPRQLSLAQFAPLLFVAVAALSWLVTLRLARTRYAWLMASLAMVATLPRLLTYEFSFLLCALAETPPWRGGSRIDQGR